MILKIPNIYKLDDKIIQKINVPKNVYSGT